MARSDWDILSVTFAKCLKHGREFNPLWAACPDCFDELENELEKILSAK